MKILLATDGSPSSETALQRIAARPWPESTEVKVISAVEVHLAPAPGSWLVPDSHYLSLLHEAQERARVAVERAESVLKTTLLQVSSEIIVGNAKATILKQAEEWGADLIVLGSHGHGVLERVLMGSVSQGVLAQAHCSVEIVR